MIQPLAAAAPDSLEARLRAVLPDLPAEECQALLSRLEPLAIEVVGTPETGLIMLTAEDCFGEPFHLGEVLVATAEVEYQRVRAHATVLGGDLEKAVLAASVNALSRHPEAAALLQPLLEPVAQCWKRWQAQREQEDRLLAGTRVHFESMATEEY